jgi:FtsP/CotA-like multicopper oxidase with cupredoxin domain
MKGTNRKANSGRAEASGTGKLGCTRRRFLGKTFMVISGLALVERFGSPAIDASPPSSSPPFKPEEIIRNAKEKKLRAVLEIKNGSRTIPRVGSGRMMRYFEGYNPADRKPRPTPSPEGFVGPGPTLRTRTGDSVEITFLNTVSISDFQQSPDKAEEAGCDIVGSLYPGNDKPPNCFHGSSTANLHFHGTHVTPNGLGDNVLIQVIPDHNTNEHEWAELFARVFEIAPSKFPQMPEEWWRRQHKLVADYDQRVKAGSEAAHRPLPTPLLPLDEEQIKHGLWPEYVIGAYPNCFTIPEPPPEGKKYYDMYQAPGTHWYHAHKHGSTSLHLFNGLAGAFIIEGAYDDDLKEFYKDGIVENVLVLQQFADRQNLMIPGNGGGSSGKNIFINGQFNPTIQMHPGEIQLWRIVNATVSQTVDTFNSLTVGKLVFRQIAQDGVQFRWENYKPASDHPAPQLQLAPGNRVDLLVQAPQTTGQFGIGIAGTQVNVSGEKMDMRFPEKAEEYPRFPEFLADTPVGDLRTRCVSFGWEPGRTIASIKAGGGPDQPPPRFTIDGVQFSESRIDQSLTLGTAEEWTLYNYTSIPHPFHIHVNPFQVIEIYDPNKNPSSYKPKQNFVWRDVINIPAASLDPNGLGLPTILLDDDGRYAKTPGHVKIRHRFVDFPGTFVLHCHILAHEDRGMMQLVTVVDPRTILMRHH